MFDFVACVHMCGLHGLHGSPTTACTDPGPGYKTPGPGAGSSGSSMETFSEVLRNILIQDSKMPSRARPHSNKQPTARYALRPTIKRVDRAEAVKRASRAALAAAAAKATQSGETCLHFAALCRVVAPCCGETFDCNECHDAAKDHVLKRSDVVTVACKTCDTVQPASNRCVGCGVQFATYYCGACKIWKQRVNLGSGIFHCDDCGLCRGGDRHSFFHCQKCQCCFHVKVLARHASGKNCVEGVLKKPCAVCLEDDMMWNPKRGAVDLPCGHALHRECFDALRETSYKCPTCRKSMFKVPEYIARVDAELARNPPPPGTPKVTVKCCDCETVSTVVRNAMHKCQNAECGGYNTDVL